MHWQGKCDLCFPAGFAERWVFSYGDQLEGELMSELENARVVRLMAKLGFINERPECGFIQLAWLAIPSLIHRNCRFSHDIRWSETGDRYIISLFRDYVFHQVDETGHPVVDLTHVITCLNKVSHRLPP
jgi:PAB-dependent poly(A)-specific ribonuclease subunit 3